MIWYEGLHAHGALACADCFLEDQPFGREEKYILAGVQSQGYPVGLCVATDRQVLSDDAEAFLSRRTL